MSGILKSVVKRHDRLAGLDCSTRSLAFSKWHKGEFVTCGEIHFEGNTVGTRLGSIHKALPPLIQSGLLDVDAVLIEAAVMVGQNPNTAIVLAYTYGAIMGAFNSEGIPVAKVRPLEWQSYIGNPNLKAAEKAAIRKQFPEHSDSWYKNYGRKVRKQKTLDWARQYAVIGDDSDNVGDAVGIGYYAVKHQHLLTFE